MAARRYDVTYTDPSWRVWALSAESWIVGLKAGGLTGLVASPEAVAFQAVGVAGQVVAGLRIPPASGSLAVLARAEGGRSAMQVAADFRRAFAFAEPLGTLSVASPVGQVMAKVRLSGGIAPPEVDDDTAEVVSMDIPLTIDSGVWWKEPVTSTGDVTVTNQGDVLIYPKISWNGAGGALTLPSQAVVELPAVSASRTIDLDPLHSRQVLTNTGTVDEALWKQLRGKVLSEGIPPGQSKTYLLPAGASLTWQEGVLDPWR